MVLPIALLAGITAFGPVLASSPDAEARPAEQPSPADAAASDPNWGVTLAQVGHFGGGSYAVATAPGRVYAGEGPVLAIYEDLGDAGLSLRNRSLLLPGLISDILVEGDLLIIALAEDVVPPSLSEGREDRYTRGGLALVDASDPDRPRFSALLSDLDAVASKLGWHDDDPRDVARVVHVRQMAFSKPHLFLATPAGLLVLDLTDPLAPRPVSHLAPYGQGLWGLTYRAPLLYVNGAVGPEVLDVSDPSNPTRVGCFRSEPRSADPGLLSKLVAPVLQPDPSGCVRPSTDGGPLVSSDQRIAATWLDRVIFFDLEDPLAPTPVDASTAEAPIVDMEMRGRWLHVLDEDGRLSLMDAGLIEAFQPRVAALDLPGRGAALSLGGERAFLASIEGGLRVVDLRQPLAPRETEARIGAPHPSQIEVQDGLAYVLGRGTGLQIFDLSTPERPIKTGAYASARTVQLIVDGQLAHLLETGGALRILDISRRGHARALATVQLPAGIFGLDVSEGLLYSSHQTVDAQGASNWSIEVRDLSRVGEAPLIDRVDLGALGFTFVIEALENRVFALGQAGLAILDRDLPETHERRSTFEFAPEVPSTSLAVTDGRAYVAIRARKAVVAIDLSDAKAPSEIAIIDRAGERLLHQLLAVSDRLYFADHLPVTGEDTPSRMGIGLMEVDGDGTSSLLTHREVMQLGTERLAGTDHFGVSMDLARDDPYLYVADSRSGVHVLRKIEGPRLFLPSILR